MRREASNRSLSANPDRPARSKVFISYSHRDAEWLARLQVHFKPLERYRAIDRWDDTRIEPGRNWRLEIQVAIARARVAVLLVSADFVASDYVTRDELPQFLDAATLEGLLILPVILRPCRLPECLAKYQAVNSPERTLQEMSAAEVERTFVRLVDTAEAWLRMSEGERDSERSGDGWAPTGLSALPAPPAPPAPPTSIVASAPIDQAAERALIQSRPSALADPREAPVFRRWRVIAWMAAGALVAAAVLTFLALAMPLWTSLLHRH